MIKLKMSIEDISEYQTETVSCFRRVGRNHESDFTAHKKHPVHIQKAQV